MTDSIFILQDQLTEAFDSLVDANKALTNALLGESGFVFYWEEGMPAPEPEEARPKIAEHLSRWIYPPEGEKFPKAVGAMGVSRETYALAERLNERKATWQALHEAIAKTFGTAENNVYNSHKGSKAIRSLINRVVGKRLNLHATDRRVPLIPGQPLSIDWVEQVSMPSERRSIQDILDELVRITQTEDEDIAVRMQQEHTRLASIDPATPVSYRPKQAVHSLRYRSRYIVDRQRKRIPGNYAGNPILFIESDPPIVPQLTVFAESSRPTVGGGVRVSSERVSRYLPHYYWYLQPKPTKNKKPLRRKNPYSSTAFPGLWLGTRKTVKGLNPTINIQLRDRSETKVSIAKLGLEAAWAKAAEIYADDYGVPLAAVIAERPTQQRVNDMLAWKELADT